jgi:hypothetical protein
MQRFNQEGNRNTLVERPDKGEWVRYSEVVEFLGRLSVDLDAFMDWAQVWHRQAGGYAASDTATTIHRIERWADVLKAMTGKSEDPLRKIK